MCSGSYLIWDPLHHNAEHVFRPPTKGTYLRKRSDGRLFNIARLKAKTTKIREQCFRDSLFVDDAAVTPHSRDELQ